MNKNRIPLAFALALPSIIGLGFAAYAYFMSGTGVTGSGGALLAMIGALAVLLGSLVAPFTARRGTVFGLLVFLIALGAALTGVAGFFLMQFGLALAMALTLIASAFVMFRVITARRPF